MNEFFERGVGRYSFLPISKDGNGVGSDQVECLCIQNRNPKLKLESAPNTHSGENLSPKSKPADPRNPTDRRSPSSNPWRREREREEWLSSPLGWERGE